MNIRIAKMDRLKALVFETPEATLHRSPHLANHIHKRRLPFSNDLDGLTQRLD